MILTGVPVDQLQVGDITDLHSINVRVRIDEVRHIQPDVVEVVVSPTGQAWELHIQGQSSIYRPGPDACECGEDHDDD